MTIPTMGMLPGDEGGGGEYKGHESYLWVVSVDAEVAGGGPATGAAARAAMAAAPSPAARQVGDGAAMRGFNKAERTGGARRCGAGARACGSRRAAACHRWHGCRTSAETTGTRKNEESMSFRESRGVNFIRGLVETVTGRWSSTAA